MTKREKELEMQVEDLERKLQIAAQLNHDMWVMLQDQVNKTEQLERVIYCEDHKNVLHKVQS